jgi:hypothetical protein
MTDDALIEEIAERLRGLPLLTAPDDIRARVRERIAEEEARPIDESVRARLASLPTLPAPPELDKQLHPIERSWSWRRRRRRRVTLPRFPRWSVNSRRRIPLAIATAAVCGTALGFVALHLVSSTQPRAAAFPAGMRTSITTFAPAFYEPQPHLRPRERRGPHLTVRVHVNSLGVPVWYTTAYTDSGHAVKPKCSSPDGATPLNASPPTATAAGPANPGAPAYSGGATLTCSADVGSAGPITATLTLVGGGGATSSSSTEGGGSSTTSSTTARSQATTSSSTPATGDGTTAP